MKLHQNILFGLIPSFLIFTKANAVYISGLKLLIKGQGDLLDSSPFKQQVKPVPESAHGITFPIDTVGAQSSRQVINFNGNGKAVGSAMGLPGGDAPRTIIGWFKNTGGSSSYATGPFGYGSTGYSTAFWSYLAGTPQALYLAYWATNVGPINPVLAPVVDEQWYHVAFAWDGEKNIVYMDGHYVKEGIPPVRPNTNVNTS